MIIKKWGLRYYAYGCEYGVCAAVAFELRLNAISKDRRRNGTAVPDPASSFGIGLHFIDERQLCS
jgi:hypothetical protein